MAMAGVTRLLLLSLAGLCTVCGDMKYLSALRSGPWKYELVEGYRVDGIIIASFNNTINETG